MNVVIVDFNDIGYDGEHVWGDVEGEATTAVGETVFARDMDGNQCNAVVTGHKNGLTIVRPDMDTWTHGGTA